MLDMPLLNIVDGFNASFASAYGNYLHASLEACALLLVLCTLFVDPSCMPSSLVPSFLPCGGAVECSLLGLTFPPCNAGIAGVSVTLQH